MTRTLPPARKTKAKARRGQQARGHFAGLPLDEWMDRAMLAARDVVADYVGAAMALVERLRDELHKVIMPIGPEALARLSTPNEDDQARFDRARELHDRFAWLDHTLGVFQGLVEPHLPGASRPSTRSR